MAVVCSWLRRELVLLVLVSMGSFAGKYLPIEKKLTCQACVGLAKSITRHKLQSCRRPGSLTRMMFTCSKLAHIHAMAENAGPEMIEERKDYEGGEEMNEEILG